MRLIFFILAINALTSSADITGTYRTIPPSIMHHFDVEHTYNGRANGNSIDGVWEQGPKVCAPFEEASIKIYAGVGQCCLAVKRLGNRYIFSKVVFSGDHRGELYPLCAHSVMERIEG